jgi:hypothetical protein
VSQGGTPVIGRGTPIAQDGPANLTIRYVERLPSLDYVWRSADPRTEGWPIPGSTVTWRAHLRNWTSTRLGGVDYAWSLDGRVAASGTVDIPASGEASVDFPWAWERQRHELLFEVDAAHRHTLPAGRLHRLLIDTDALAVGFYVERSLSEYFRARQPELRLGRSSFEDWAHEQIRFYNEILAAARYPETPQGVLDRLRLDRVTVVADGSLPLDPLGYSVGGGDNPAEARSNVPDRTVDMQWGFPSRLLDGVAYRDTTSLDPHNGFYYSGSVQHELGHARYLMDIYSFNVFHGGYGSRVEIREGGELVAGSARMRGRTTPTPEGDVLLVHETPHQGMMNSDWSYLDRPSAVAWNLIAGRRAIAGNYNEPENIAVFLNDLPRENRLTLLDSQGRPLGGARLRVYRGVRGDTSAYSYAKLFDDRPDLELRADGQGRVLLGQNPFADVPLDTQEYSNAVAILRVEHEGGIGYHFLEAVEFNLEYWRGHADLGEYELRLELL